jgi:hypothetical protein
MTQKLVQAGSVLAIVVITFLAVVLLRPPASALQWVFIGLGVVTTLKTARGYGSGGAGHVT